MKAIRMKMEKVSDLSIEKRKKMELDQLKRNEESQLVKQFQTDLQREQFREYQRKLDKQRRLADVQGNNWQTHEQKSEQKKKLKLDEIEVVKIHLKELRSKSTRMGQIERRQQAQKEWVNDLKEQIRDRSSLYGSVIGVDSQQSWGSLNRSDVNDLDFKKLAMQRQLKKRQEEIRLKNEIMHQMQS